MAVRQIGQHRRGDFAAQPVHHGLQLVALVVRRQLVVGELPQQHRFLLRQHTRVQQLGEHALDAVGVLVHVFNEQNTAGHLRQIGRAHQRAQHRQVATPQPRRRDFKLLRHGGRYRLRGHSAGAGLVARHAPASALAVPREHVVKAGFHDVVRQALNAKISAQRRPGPGHGAGLGQHGVLEGGEIAHADKQRAALDGAGHGGVVDVRQQPGQAVAAARDQRHIGTAGSGAVDGGQARGVVARKTGVAGQGVGVNLDLVAQRLQALDAALERGLVAYCAGGGVDVDVLGAVVVAAIARGVFRRQSARAARGGPLRGMCGGGCAAQAARAGDIKARSIPQPAGPAQRRARATNVRPGAPRWAQGSHALGVAGAAWPPAPIPDRPARPWPACAQPSHGAKNPVPRAPGQP